MKRGLWLLFAVTASFTYFAPEVFGSPANPTNIPNCWDESGKDLEDGDFILSIDAGVFPQARKSEFETLINTRPLRIAHDFSRGRAGIYILRTDFHELDAQWMSRDLLKDKVNSLLEEAAEFPGISIDCNYRVSAAVEPQ